MNRKILRLALPNIISNITVPVMGIISTAIAGHWGDDPAHTIGALAIGVSIFNFIYWNCSFLRMGTSGMTAQAFGAGDLTECSAMLARTLIISAALGIAILILQYPLGELALHIMNGDRLVSRYFYARIWAVPAGIILFGLNGWFTGMQNAVIPMCTSIAVNAVHILCSLYFAFGLQLGIVGIAYASVVAQYAGVLLSLLLLGLRYRKHLTRIPRKQLLDRKPVIRFFRVNTDIIIRTFCIVAVYTFFTAASARMDDPAMLAVNTLLLQLFTMFSYMSDGFAYAAEALTGRFTGARDAASLRECIRKCIVWSLGISLFFVAVYAGWWQEIFSLFLADSPENNDILDTARRFIGWVMAVSLCSAIPFLLDGVMVGATMTRIMRNSLLIATTLHFILFFALKPLIGNNALWLAFTSFMVARGIAQYLLSDRLDKIYSQAQHN
ncbi:MAG: MATE family efflux transporter [Alistipes sp.]|nr:MATE family efflux transporter [Alistipes sp.]